MSIGNSVVQCTHVRVCLGVASVRASPVTGDSDDPRHLTRSDFESFVAETEPKLRAAFISLYGPETGRDATAEALAYAWQHWEQIQSLDNALGYLFRVGQSNTRRLRRKSPMLPLDNRGESEVWIEPGLPAALSALPQRQRVVVVLAHGFGLSHTEIAELLGIRRSSVQNHVERGLKRLRQHLEVDDDHR